jgi:signal transduction histidine kinase
MSSNQHRMTSPHAESARLRALARVAEAAARGGEVDDVLQAMAEGVQSAFGFAAVLNMYDEERHVYVVRAGVGDGFDEILGEEYTPESWDPLLADRFEVIPDVCFLPHDARPPQADLGVVVTPAYPWRGPGYWHAQDMCFIRMRTSQGKQLGILSVDSPVEAPLPDEEMFEVLRLFAVVGSNAVENVMLMREVKGLSIEREMKALRQELEEEIALRRSLLDIGTRLGAATSETSRDLFELVAKRLHEVVPIKALTIYDADHEAGICRPIYHSADEPDTDAILSFDIPFDVGCTGGAASERRSIVSNIGQADRPLVSVPDTDDIDEHLLAVPVLVEEQARAVLTLVRLSHQPPFTDTDTYRAELFAQHVASVFLLNELAQSRQLLAQQVEQLQDLNRLKDEFVANVSHELRTPLTAIMGNVMTVAGLGDMLGEQERRELLTGAERQSKRLAELLENLLAESRLVGDDPAIVPSRVEVGPFVHEVAETLRFKAQHRAIEVKVGGRLVIVTDRTLLYRILFNLGDNALKYSDGSVRLEAEAADDGGVRIDVIDGGVGIASEDIPRIFEQFQQLDGSTSRSVGGVGLGLHLCARASAALGGRIDVQSAVGAGSTFSLWLPRQCPRRD